MAVTVGERSVRCWRTAHQLTSPEVIHYDTLCYLIGLLHYEIKRGRRKFLLLGDEDTLTRIWIGGTLGNRYTRLEHIVTCYALRDLNKVCDEIRFKGVPPESNPAFKVWYDGAEAYEEMRREEERKAEIWAWFNEKYELRKAKIEGKAMWAELNKFELTKPTIAEETNVSPDTISKTPTRQDFDNLEYIMSMWDKEAEPCTKALSEWGFKFSGSTPVEATFIHGEGGKITLQHFACWNLDKFPYAKWWAFTGQGLYLLKAKMKDVMMTPAERRLALLAIMDKWPHSGDIVELLDEHKFHARVVDNESATLENPDGHTLTVCADGKWSTGENPYNFGNPVSKGGWRQLGWKLSEEDCTVEGIA